MLVAQAGDFNTLISLELDDQFVAACSSEVPPLAKEAAIAGLLAQSDAQCIAALKDESSVWGESICDGDSGCGCVAREGARAGNIRLDGPAPGVRAPSATPMMRARSRPTPARR
ncbi:hypothetical protein [Nannocystis pusilla]|uniref:hypothetical protein n=1 Tax=Nannocystis pusilla TaxID=889268 RepID=UPI003B77390E